MTEKNRKKKDKKESHMELEKSNNLQKRLKNLANKLREDENRVLFGKSNEISGKLEKNLKNSKYEKESCFWVDD